MPTESERLMMLERNQSDLGKSISEIVQDQRGVKSEVAGLHQVNAVREAEDRHLDDRLDRIEKSLAAVYGLGRWLLAAIGSVLVVAIVGFVLKGGPLG